MSHDIVKEVEWLLSEYIPERSRILVEILHVFINYLIAALNVSIKSSLAPIDGDNKVQSKLAVSSAGWFFEQRTIFSS